MCSTREILPRHPLRCVADAGLDDRKIFAWMDQLGAEFVIRASHLERLVAVHNPHLKRWGSETPQDLLDTVPFEATFQVAFTHAGRTRLAEIRLGWFLIRLPQTQQQLWVLVAENTTKERTLVLITNVPLTSLQQVKAVYADWRLRARIEHGYRFDQEQGLEVEDLRVRTLERMRRLFALLLLAPMFVFYLMKTWPRQAAYWLRMLGGKLGLSTDRDDPHILLRGIRAVCQTEATLSFLAKHPFPHEAFLCNVGNHQVSMQRTVSLVQEIPDDSDDGACDSQAQPTKALNQASIRQPARLLPALSPALGRQTRQAPNSLSERYTTVCKVESRR